MRNVKRILNWVALLLFSGTAFAEGDRVPGYVKIGPDNSYMIGTFSVRFDATPTVYPTYIGAGGYAGGVLYFYGQDAEGQQFYCYIPTSSGIYDASVDIKNTLSLGSLLSVSRKLPSSECSAVYSAKASHYLN